MEKRTLRCPWIFSFLCKSFPTKSSTKRTRSLFIHYPCDDIHSTSKSYRGGVSISRRDIANKFTRNPVHHLGQLCEIQSVCIGWPRKERGGEFQEERPSKHRIEPQGRGSLWGGPQRWSPWRRRGWQWQQGWRRWRPSWSRSRCRRTSGQLQGIGEGTEIKVRSVQQFYNTAGRLSRVTSTRFAMTNAFQHEWTTSSNHSEQTCPMSICLLGNFSHESVTPTRPATIPANQNSAPKHKTQLQQNSPLGAWLGAKAMEAAIMQKRVTIWKVFMIGY